MLLLSCNCPCACATTNEFQQQQQQHYIGIIIIKRWICRKICNNLCRCICMLLLLYNVLVVHLYLWMHNGRWTTRTTTWYTWPWPSLLQLTIDPWKTIILNTSGWWTPLSITHGSLEDHYTKQFSWQTDTPLLQLTIDPCKTTTPNKFHDRLTPPPPPIDHRCMEDHYTT